MFKRYNIVVIGAGPVGTVAASAFAQRGERVLLLEANPAAANRYAGEWLHPPGVEVLDELGLTPLDADSGQGHLDGFVVYPDPDDAGAPITLPYPDGKHSLTCEHRELVGALRHKVRQHPRVDYRPYARVTGLADGRVVYEQNSADQRRGGTQHIVPADLVVAADGRSSLSRPTERNKRTSVVSYMGVLSLGDVDLPFDGYGHVLLGGPGPALLYRLNPNLVRLSLDVPASERQLRRDPAALLDAFRPVLPDALVEPVEQAMATQRMQWAATHFRPRTNYGRGRIAAVGDAVGCLHPMTAAGMTLGMQDAHALVKSDSLVEYRARRAPASHIPELLSSALYQVFTGHSREAASLRQAVYDTWRAHPQECRRTMALLSGAETGSWAFAASFVRIGLQAISDEFNPNLIPWGSWPLAAVLPASVGQRLRHDSRVDTPFPVVQELLDDQSRAAFSRLSRLLPAALLPGSQGPTSGSNR